MRAQLVETSARFWAWYGLPLVLALLAGCGGADDTDTEAPPVTPPDIAPAPEPAPEPAPPIILPDPITCGDGLAAVDVAGNCRIWNMPCQHDPLQTCGTPGALEPVQ